jgi:DNA-binding transcriptional ArsR family regulator
VFEINAEPNRRAISSLLVSSQPSVGEMERQRRMPQPTVSKHLRVPREAGFVESTVDAPRRLYRLRPGPFRRSMLAGFASSVLAHSCRYSRTPPRPHGSINTNEKEDQRARVSAALVPRSKPVNFVN